MSAYSLVKRSPTGPVVLASNESFAAVYAAIPDTAAHWYDSRETAQGFLDALTGPASKSVAHALMHHAVVVATEGNVVYRIVELP